MPESRHGRRLSRSPQALGGSGVSQSESSEDAARFICELLYCSAVPRRRLRHRGDSAGRFQPEQLGHRPGRANPELSVSQRLPAASLPVPRLLLSANDSEALSGATGRGQGRPAPRAARGWPQGTVLHPPRQPWEPVPDRADGTRLREQASGEPSPQVRRGAHGTRPHVRTPGRLCHSGPGPWTDRRLPLRTRSWPPIGHLSGLQTPASPGVLAPSAACPCGTPGTPWTASCTRRSQSCSPGDTAGTSP